MGMPVYGMRMPVYGICEQQMYSLIITFVVYSLERIIGMHEASWRATWSLEINWLVSLSPKISYLIWIYSFIGIKIILSYMGLNTRKPVFRICKEQRCGPACASAQSDQHLYYLLIGKYCIKNCYHGIFKFLGSLCS